MKTMGKVAIFIDGKNFYEGLRTSGLSSRVDFKLLSKMIVREVDGGMLTGLHYYTGVSDEMTDLSNFLAFLENQPGCFVNRFHRRSRSVTCSECGKSHEYTEEKEVDTSMVSDMIRQAAVNAFDTAVLCSGDADLTPAFEALRDFGKPAWVATYGGHGLSRRLRQAAYGHIDLVDIVERSEQESSGTIDMMSLVEAVKDAENYFGENRYVGLNMFLNDWRSKKLPRDQLTRTQLLRQAVEEGWLETYMVEGCKAVKSTTDRSDDEDDEVQQDRGAGSTQEES